MSIGIGLVATVLLARMEDREEASGASEMRVGRGAKSAKRTALGSGATARLPTGSREAWVWKRGWGARRVPVGAVTAEPLGAQYHWCGEALREREHQQKSIDIRSDDIEANGKSKCNLR